MNLCSVLIVLATSLSLIQGQEGGSVYIIHVPESDYWICLEVGDKIGTYAKVVAIGEENKLTGDTESWIYDKTVSEEIEFTSITDADQEHNVRVYVRKRDGDGEKVGEGEELSPNAVGSLGPQGAETSPGKTEKYRPPGHALICSPPQPRPADAPPSP